MDIYLRRAKHAKTLFAACKGRFWLLSNSLGMEI